MPPNLWPPGPHNTEPSGAPFLSVDGLALGERVKGVSFDLMAGQMLALIGPNGAGKSSLLECLAGISRPTGQVRLGGKPLGEMAGLTRAQRIGYLAQSQTSCWPLRVRDVVALGRLPWGDRDSESGRRACDAAMEETELTLLAQRPVSTLSGGEQSRVWLARVLAGNPGLILADEPIASLDLKHQREALSILRKWARDQKAVILAIHDLGLAARWCDLVLILERGSLRAFGPPQQVLTEQLLSSVFEAPVLVDLKANPPVIVLK